MNLSGVIKAFIWALFIGCFVCFFTNKYEEEIRKLLSEIAELGIGKLWFKFIRQETENKEFAKPALSQVIEEEEKQERRGIIDGRKTGNLFWLANNIMWTKAALFLDSPRDSILEGLRDSLEGVKLVGLADTYADQKLDYFISYVKATPEIDRKDLANQLEIVKQYIANRAETYQSEAI